MAEKSQPDLVGHGLLAAVELIQHVVSQWNEYFQTPFSSLVPGQALTPSAYMETLC